MNIDVFKHNGTVLPNIFNFTPEKFFTIDMMVQSDTCDSNETLQDINVAEIHCKDGLKIYEKYSSLKSLVIMEREYC